jgi:hypothetical protein
MTKSSESNIQYIPFPKYPSSKEDKAANPVSAIFSETNRPVAWQTKRINTEPKLQHNDSTYMEELVQRDCHSNCTNRPSSGIRSKSIAAQLRNP